MSLSELTGDLAEDVVVGSGTVVLPRVDLLPPEIREAARFRRLQRSLALAVAGAVGVVGLVYLGATGAVDDAQGRVDAATSVQTGLQAEVASYRDVQARHAQAAAAREMLVRAMGPEVRFSGLLDDLALSVPDGVWLTSAAFTQTPAGGAAAGSAVAGGAAAAAGSTSTATGIGTITMSGYALAYEGVARWLDAAAAQRAYAAPYLQTSQEEKVNDKQVINWSTTIVLTSDALSGRYSRTGS